MLSKNELKDFITTTVTTLMKELEVRLKNDLEKKVKEVVKERTTELSDRLDSLTFENVQLRECLEKAEKKMKANGTLAQKKQCRRATITSNTLAKTTLKLWE